MISNNTALTDPDGRETHEGTHRQYALQRDDKEGGRLGAASGGRRAVRQACDLVDALVVQQLVARGLERHIEGQRCPLHALKAVEALKVSVVVDFEVSCRASET